jgi:G3E family GTPase
VPKEISMKQLVDRARQARIPVTVVGGYLGAGKTTLLRHLLEHGDGRRIAVVLNDFGKIGLDADVIAHRSADTVVLANGCICCGLGGEFATALANLAARPEPPEHVLIEASGITNPRRITGYGYMPGFRPDGTVVVVDASNVRALVDDAETTTLVLDQLRTADVLVVNKLDRVSDNIRLSLQRWLRGLVPHARLIESRDGRVSLPLVIGIEPGSEATYGRTMFGTWAATYSVSDRQDRRRGRVSPADECHEDDYRSWCLTSAEAIDGEDFRSWVSSLPESILRGKGILQLREDPAYRYAFQLVGEHWTLERDRPWLEESASSRLVLVGLSSGKQGRAAAHGTRRGVSAPNALISTGAGASADDGTLRLT